MMLCVDVPITHKDPAKRRAFYCCANADMHRLTHYITTHAGAVPSSGGEDHESRIHKGGGSFPQTTARSDGFPKSPEANPPAGDFRSLDGQAGIFTTAVVQQQHQNVSVTGRQVMCPRAWAKGKPPREKDVQLVMMAKEKDRPPAGEIPGGQ